MSRALGGCRKAVHPRVGGEHRFASTPISASTGSSPRGRGTRGFARQFRRLRRFIPAWAGNTRKWAPGPPPSSVHPRVGGEHADELLPAFAQGGSSPRGRGTHRPFVRHHRRRRFIPAWAGNTVVKVAHSAASAVHPRVGGEHRVALAANVIDNGSSPRGRGTRKMANAPRYRMRFIPAWAGNTRAGTRETDTQAVHPRVGGEHQTSTTPKPRPTGSSPRGRGTHNGVELLQIVGRFIPAWAGNTLAASSRAPPLTVHPRVGGEHSSDMAELLSRNGSSPRGRGTPSLDGVTHQVHRFIPAWAGNTRSNRSRSGFGTVHPRVGGEH